MTYYSKSRLEILTFIPIEAKRILEVGCGEGVFLKQIKDRQKAEIWGVELDSYSAAKAKEVVHKVFNNDISDIIDDLPNNYFDCIIFNDVLEHLIDPYSLLKKISYKINRNGVVVSSIPNIRYFKVLYHLIISKRWDYKDYGVLDKTHLRFFTFKNIKELFESNGYNIIVLKGINPSYSMIYKFINFLSVGFFWDSRFIQFVCVAKVK